MAPGRRRKSRQTQECPGIFASIDILRSVVGVRVGVLHESPDAGIRELFGVAEQPLGGVRGDEIVDLDAATESIRAALIEAEDKADVSIRSADLWVGLTNPQGHEFSISGGLGPSKLPDWERDYNPKAILDACLEFYEFSDARAVEPRILRAFAIRIKACLALVRSVGLEVEGVNFSYSGCETLFGLTREELDAVLADARVWQTMMAARWANRFMT